ncbi:MAG: tRNA (adenosine(37)-N6)-threonylcarbamoyltransferase complex dimerization subunit type 1 TsaB [Burkholderiales bacterium]|nr:tRNA (adenosine(37)-N6)-threonylcarbamoyltransferase complex dimerization subunit type 1 TsaB [Burkholderiales bacterium]
MNILALDASTEHCSAAVWRDGAVFERAARAGQAHSEMLIAMADAVMAEAGIALPRVSGIAFGAGPGSFTGLRVACAVAQGLAFPADIPLAGIGTLQAMATGCGADAVVCCLDARMGEVYHAAYRRDGDAYAEVSAPRVCAPAAVPELPPGQWTACGGGFAVYGDVLRLRYGAQLENVVAELVPQAGDIARLAAAVFAAGGGKRADDAAPLYVRDRVALKTSER